MYYMQCLCLQILEYETFVCGHYIRTMNWIKFNYIHYDDCIYYITAISVYVTSVFASFKIWNITLCLLHLYNELQKYNYIQCFVYIETTIFMKTHINIIKTFECWLNVPLQILAKYPLAKCPLAKCPGFSDSMFPRLPYYHSYIPLFYSISPNKLFHPELAVASWLPPHAVHVSQKRAYNRPYVTRLTMTISNS